MDARDGMRMGHKKVMDSLLQDGLWDPYGDMHMGNCAEVLARKKTTAVKSKIILQ